jgi:hypothetical protein
VEHRALWVAVVMQARADIESEDRDGYDYAQAAAFFTGGGDWARSRQSIADCLELHPDDLMRLGRAAIAARRLRDGDVPVMVPVPAKGLRATAPEVCITNTSPVVPVVVVPAEPIPIVKRGRPRKPVHDKNWWIQDFLRREAA